MPSPSASVAKDPFVHLHVHSDYSLLDGACEITQLVSQARAQGMQALALTDHGNLFGAWKFYEAASAQGIKPIIGCELYIAQAADHTQAPRGQTENGGYNHLIVLCENATGYRNLIKIVSEASLHGFYYKPRISKAYLAEHSAGLIGLSACLKGEVQEALVAGRTADARRAAGEFGDLFGPGRFYLEIQNQGLEQEHRIQPALVELSRETGLPLVATNDCHYLRHEDARMHDVLLCIQMGKRLQDAQRMRFGSDQFFLKSGAEMLQMFSGVEDAVVRTREIAERCDLKLAPVDNPFPDFGVPAGVTLDAHFEAVTRAGMSEREAWIEERRRAGKVRYSPTQYRERLEREIRVIREMRYPGYFLIVWDFIRFARSRGIPVGPGRGSAAGSLVSYALGITDLDPLENELLFERFLNPERISLPDIDIDFCMNRRGEVIEYVTGKYGRDNVSQIITFGTMAAKQAIKDVGRAMDLPYGEVDRIAKMVPEALKTTLAQALEQSGELRRLYETDPRIRELIDVAQKVEGLHRHAGVHAAGVVIAPRPLTELVPLHKTSRDEIVTQFDMTALEKIGLIKMDFLGLTTLTILQEALSMIQRNRGVEIDLARLPENDAATFEVFCKGQTTGIFQFESQGMRDILRRYRPDRLSDLTALNALYRPGPIQGGMISDFIARRHGRMPIAYELPELEPILAETFGVFVYQEQVMQAASRLAGYSLGEADVLRRAMGKKKADEMARQREKFLRGAAAQKINAEKAGHIFDLMAEFAGYGFNKSHAAAYAWLAYQTAYLKAHYPVEFLAALLSSSVGDTDSVVKYIRECREMGIAIEPPDLSISLSNFTPQGDSIRFGLSAIRNLGETAVQAILTARAERPFSGLYDLCARAGGKVLNRRILESLIKSGALDRFGPRAALMNALEPAIENAQQRERERQSGQHGLFIDFTGDGGAVDAEPPLPAAPDWDEDVRLASEKEVLGYYVSGHPLDRFADRLIELNVVALDAIDSYADADRSAELAVAGVLSQLQIKRNKKAEAWATAILEDTTGRRELLCFAGDYRRLEAQMRLTQPVWVKARVLDGGDFRGGEAGPSQVKLGVVDIRDLATLQPTLPRLLHLDLALDRLDPEALDRLRAALNGAGGSAKIQVRAFSTAEQFEQVLELDAGAEVNGALRRRLSQILGAPAVRVLD